MENKYFEIFIKICGSEKKAGEILKVSQQAISSIRCARTNLNIEKARVISGYLRSKLELDFLPEELISTVKKKRHKLSHSILFYELPIQFGPGDGTSTFNIPNMARRIPVGSRGTATPTLGNTVGSVGGEESHTMTVAELVSHTHQFDAGVPLSVGGAAGDDVTGGKATFTTHPTGNSQPFNIMQPSIVFHYFIKY